MSIYLKLFSSVLKVYFLMSKEVPLDFNAIIEQYGSDKEALEILSMFESSMFVHKAFVPLLKAIVENDDDRAFKESHLMVGTA